MSILDENLTTQPIKPHIIAHNLKLATVQTFQIMVNSFNFGSQNFWNNPDASPTEIAQELGADAKEVFQLHYALGQLIANIKPETISQGLSVIGQFNMNEDGTVTIIESNSTTTTPSPITE